MDSSTVESENEKLSSVVKNMQATTPAKSKSSGQKAITPRKTTAELKNMQAKTPAKSNSPVQKAITPRKTTAELKNMQAKTPAKSNSPVQKAITPRRTAAELKNMQAKTSAKSNSPVQIAITPRKTVAIPKILRYKRKQTTNINENRKRSNTTVEEQILDWDDESTESERSCPIDHNDICANFKEEGDRRCFCNGGELFGLKCRKCKIIFKDIDDGKCYVVSYKKPIHICTGRTSRNECNYALCMNCYNEQNEELNGKARRKRAASTKAMEQMVNNKK